MSQRNFFTGEKCFANVDIPGLGGAVFAVEGGRLQIMAYDPGKAETPHGVRAISDGITPVSNIARQWVGESQLRKDPSQIGVRLPDVNP